MDGINKINKIFSYFLILNIPAPDLVFERNSLFSGCRARAGLSILSKYQVPARIMQDL